MTDEHQHPLLETFIEERESGLTYREIGERHNMSHERVRQVLVGGDVQSKPRNWAAERRREHMVQQITEWLEAHGPTTSDKVREQFGLSIQQLSELVNRGIPRHLVLAGGGRTGSAHTDDSIMEALRHAWEVQQRENPEAKSLSVIGYNVYRREQDPSPALITARLSWTDICERAGIPTNNGRGEYTRRWSDSDLLGWIASYVDDVATRQERVTFYGYDKWRQGRENAPSGALVRTRLRRSGFPTWGSMVAAAVRPSS